MTKTKSKHKPNPAHTAITAEQWLSLFDQALDHAKAEGTPEAAQLAADVGALGAHYATDAFVKRRAKAAMKRAQP